MLVNERCSCQLSVSLRPDSEEGELPEISAQDLVPAPSPLAASGTYFHFHLSFHLFYCFVNIFLLFSSHFHTPSGYQLRYSPSPGGRSEGRLDFPKYRPWLVVSQIRLLNTDPYF